MNRLDSAKGKKKFRGKNLHADIYLGQKIAAETLIFCNPHNFTWSCNWMSLLLAYHRHNIQSPFFFAAIEWLCNNLEWPPKGICWYSHNRNGVFDPKKKNLQWQFCSIIGQSIWRENCPFFWSNTSKYGINVRCTIRIFFRKITAKNFTFFSCASKIIFIDSLEKRGPVWSKTFN